MKHEQIYVSIMLYFSFTILKKKFKSTKIHLYQIFMNLNEI